MIYLIDDNQNNQRLNEYQISFIEENVYSDYLTNIEKLEKLGGASDISHLNFLTKNAKCILLHSTIEDVDLKGNYIEGATTNSIKIKEVISDDGKKIPLVLFSNRMEQLADFDYDANPNFIRSIKKNVFYMRLWNFVENYKTTGEIELRIIAYGKNFLASETRKLANSLLEPIALKSSNTLLKLTDIKNQRSFKIFISDSFPSLNWKEVLFDLEDNPITIEQFRSKIDKVTESINKYGKNIYSW